jgi:hypothetical protein
MLCVVVLISQRAKKSTAPFLEENGEFESQDFKAFR